jgi:signal transduction histidine kinase
MKQEICSETLRNALDPILLVDNAGMTQWLNTAAQNVLPPEITSEGLLSFLDKESLLTIGKTGHYSTLEVVPHKGTLAGLKQSAIILDVSQNELEERSLLIMLTSTKAEGATIKEKQEWLTSAAHDLKNPLSAIFGYADTLLDTPAGTGMSQEQRMILARIRGTASRATELVRNYQHLSHLALKGIAQSGTRADLNGAIHDLLNTTWREDPENPRVVLHLLSEPLPALIDRLHLDRILSNLFSNALKFSPPNSTVTVRSGRDDSGFAWVSFNNGGNPIPEAELATLFTPFNRLSNSRGKPGSGLGLTIVRRIVEGLGGRIAVASSQAEGTTFTVNLPM